MEIPRSGLLSCLGNLSIKKIIHSIHKKSFIPFTALISATFIILSSAEASLWRPTPSAEVNPETAHAAFLRAGRSSWDLDFATGPLIATRSRSIYFFFGQVFLWEGWRTFLTSRAWSMREVFKWRKSEVEFILKIEQKRFGVRYAIVSLWKKAKIWVKKPCMTRGRSWYACTCAN